MNYEMDCCVTRTEVLRGRTLLQGDAAVWVTVQVLHRDLKYIPMTSY